MRLSAISLSIVLLTTTTTLYNNNGADAFKVGGSEGHNNDIMNKAIEDALQTKIAPVKDTMGEGEAVEGFPPLRNQILGTEVPVSFVVYVLVVSRK